MNDFTLDSLAKLFALAANRQSEENSDRFVNVFKLFLSAEIEDKFIHDYVDIFVKYLQDFSSASSKKRVSLNSVKLIKICEDIRVNLSITERLIIIYYLIVLIEETGFSDISRAFTELISDMFGISHDLYSNLSDFISNNKGGKYQVLYNDRTRIAEILLTDLDIIFIKPLVNDLKLNDRNIKSDSVVYMLKDSVLVFKDIKKFFYPELYLLAENDKYIGTDKFYLKIHEIELTKKNKHILHKSSVDFCSGELIAIIGKSGSGKTSFLRSVAGLEKKAKGEVCFLGNNSNQVLNKAFVPQNNDFIPLFSVEEHLAHRCDYLQFPSDKSKQRLAEVLADTGLIEERNKIVCKSDKSTYQLSGGQQKRLGIAMELLNQPDVLFLDEPTSGLSSEDSYKIVTLLRSIANQNKIIVASIHQPDFNTFMVFDKVLIIDEGGYPVYFGTPADSVDYFRKTLAKVDKNTLIETKYNPAVLLKMIEERQFDENGNATGQRKMMASDYYQGFINNSRLEIKGDILQTTKTNKQNNLISFFNQLKFSFSVDLKQKTRLILLLLVPLLSGIVFSILLRYSPTQSYIYFYNPNIPVWILIILTTAIFTGLVNSGHEFIYLRHFHQHENRIIDKTYSYLSSTVFKYLILAIVQAVFLILPSVLIIENGFHFFTLFIVSFLLICWGSLISLIISSLCKQISTVYLVIPLVIIPQMIFSGAMINFGDFNKLINDKGKVPFVADLIPMRWATEAVITDFYTNNPYYRDIYPIRQHINNAVYYLDYFIPQVEEIAKIDKIRAEKILKNETKNPGFVDFFNGSQLELRPIEDFYSAQIQKYLLCEDSILTMKSEINMQKYKYSNEAVNKVINNPYSTPLVILEKSILRNFKSVYSFPCTKDLNRSYFKSYGKFGNIELVCFTYNSVILSIYIILLIILLFIFKKSKNLNSICQ